MVVEPAVALQIAEAMKKDAAVQVVTGDLEQNEFYIFGENEQIPEQVVAKHQDVTMVVLGGDEQVVSLKKDAFQKTLEDVASKRAEMKTLAAYQADVDNYAQLALTESNVRLALGKGDGQRKHRLAVKQYLNAELARFVALISVVSPNTLMEDSRRNYVEIIKVAAAEPALQRVAKLENPTLSVNRHLHQDHLQIAEALKVELPRTMFSMHNADMKKIAEGELHRNYVLVSPSKKAVALDKAVSVNMAENFNPTAVIADAIKVSANFDLPKRRHFQLNNPLLVMVDIKPEKRAAKIRLAVKDQSSEKAAHPISASTAAKVKAAVVARVAKDIKGVAALAAVDNAKFIQSHVHHQPTVLAEKLTIAMLSPVVKLSDVGTKKFAVKQEATAKPATIKHTKIKSSKTVAKKSDTAKQARLAARERAMALLEKQLDAETTPTVHSRKEVAKSYVLRSPATDSNKITKVVAPTHTASLQAAQQTKAPKIVSRHRAAEAEHLPRKIYRNRDFVEAKPRVSQKSVHAKRHKRHRPTQYNIASIGQPLSDRDAQKRSRKWRDAREFSKLMQE